MRPTNDAELIRRGIPTRDGKFLAGYSPRGLAELHFPTAATETQRRGGKAAQQIVDRWHRITTAALKAILAGRAPKVFPPLDLTAGTAFQQSVWHALKEIPRGETRSYSEIARAIGRPKGVRAVGGACGANPIPVFVPCHRVLAAKGRLGGFSGGLAWKRKLLAREGITPA